VAVDGERGRETGLPPEQERIRARCVHPTGTFVPFPRDALECSISDRFEAVAQTQPDRVAVKTHHQTLSYRELHELEDRIAGTVRERSGLGKGSVALLFEHGADVIAAMLGVLRTGRPYVPLDPTYPVARLAHSLEDSQATLILTNARNRRAADDLGRGVVPVVSIDALSMGGLILPAGPAPAPTDLALILYTSGSTGQPKGVPQPHVNVLHDVMHYTNAAHFCRDDRFVLLSSCSFADSTRTIYSALLNGAGLYPFDVARDGLPALATWLREQQLTVYRSVPTLFRHFTAVLADDEQFPAVRVVFLAGEPVYRTDVEAYRRHFSSDCIFVNRLGTSEALTFSCYFVDRNTRITAAAVPVGYAVSDKDVLLLDEQPDGDSSARIGEIAVRSRYLSPGYWRRPDLTHEIFLPDPAGTDARVYRTGDLGRFLPDRCLVHLGRKDSQVKVRGHRIEPGEIESTLVAHPEVRDAVVTLHDDRQGSPRLVAYLVVKMAPGPTVSDLCRFLVERVPDYLIPATFVFVDAIPLTPTGKVDRRALPEPGTERPALDTSFVAPTTPLERGLAGIWAEVLGLDQVGIQDRFLDLGGDSLLALKVCARIPDAFGVEPPMRALLAASTIAEMAEVLCNHAASKISRKNLARLVDDAKRVPGDPPTPGQG
jgi:amino acid adenylation domain-containing protein